MDERVVEIADEVVGVMETQNDYHCTQNSNLTFTTIFLNDE